VDLEGPRDDEVLVKNSAVGVCHTDVAAQTQELPVPLPAVLGHEGSGIVVEVGKNVKNLKVGDHVVVSYSFCGECPSCIAGKFARCESLEDINFGGKMPDGTTRLSKDGKSLSTFFGQSSFATHSVVHKLSAVKIAPSIDLAIAAPLGCGIMTGAGTVINRFRPEFGSSLSVFGCGTVGMSAIMGGKIAGCSHIIAVGGNAKSLELAREMGATDTINRKEVDDIPAAIRKITRRGSDYALDTSGVVSVIKTALKSLRPAGTFCTLAHVADSAQLNYDDFHGIDIVNVNDGDANPRLFIPQMLDYHKMGKFPFDKMVSLYDFADINKAVADSSAGRAIKAVCRF
jgi:aryl-alcohol dehydrogenase